MGLGAPWLLAGLLALGLPVWLHLLQRHKNEPLRFSSLMFFEKHTQSSVKHRRLRYLLLFALRMLLLALLGLAFTQPFTMRDAAAVSAGKRLHLIAIDNSFSMRQGGHLDQARQEASRLAGSLGGQDTAQVLAFSQGVQLMGEPTADTAQLRASIAAIAAGDGRGSLAELVRAVRSVSQSSRTPLRVHLFSDLQKTALPASFSDLRLPEGVEMVVHASATRRLKNLAVESVVAPRRVYDPKRVRILATVTSFGADAAERRVALVLNAKEVASKKVTVPAGGRAVAEFLSLDAPFGWSRAEVRLDPPDEFPQDDHFFFSLERSDPKKLLFVHESRGQKALLYFRAAMEASADAAFTIDAAPVEQASARFASGKYAVAVVSDAALTPEFEQTLRTFARGGGGVLIALGRTALPGRKTPVTGEAIEDAGYSGREGLRFQTVASLDVAHPALAGTGKWEGVKFYQAARLRDAKSRVLARLSDQSPLLLESSPGEGRVLLFTSTFDNLANDLPLHSAWVPFIEQAVNYLGRVENTGRTLTVGASYDLRNSAGGGASVEVLDPDGGRALTLAESAKTRSIALQREGIYDVRRPNGLSELVAANADRLESDFELIPSESLALWQNTGQAPSAAGAAQENRKKPFEWGWFVLLAAFVLALAESITGNRHLSVEKEAA